MLNRITAIAENLLRAPSESFLPHKDAALERIQNFVDEMRFFNFSETNLPPDIMGDCISVAHTQERITTNMGNLNYTRHGLGNGVAMLQIYDSATRRVDAIWYLDTETRKAMEIVGGLSKNKIPVEAMMPGKDSRYVFDDVSSIYHPLLVPGEMIGEGHCGDDSPTDIVRVLSLSPGHEAGHALSELDEQFTQKSAWHDVFKGWSFSKDKPKERPGSSDERIANICAFKIAQNAIKNGVNLWRGQSSVDIIKRQNQELHGKGIPSERFRDME